MGDLVYYQQQVGYYLEYLLFNLPGYLILTLILREVVPINQIVCSHAKDETSNLEFFTNQLWKI